MTVKTTLSFTDRHHRFIAEQVEKGVYATASASVAAAIEQMMQAEEERQLMISALADVIRERAASRARITSTRKRRSPRSPRSWGSTTSEAIHRPASSWRL